jgi:hypothetical protein
MVQKVQFVEMIEHFVHEELHGRQTYGLRTSLEN